MKPYIFGLEAYPTWFGRYRASGHVALMPESPYRSLFAFGYANRSATAKTPAEALAECRKKLEAVWEKDKERHRAKMEARVTEADIENE